MSRSRQRVTVLGATGSIGRSSLDVIGRHPEYFEVFALAAQRDHIRMFQLIKLHRPQLVVMTDAAAAQALRTLLLTEAFTCEVLSGADSLIWVSAEASVTTVIAGIVGAAGLPPTLAAVRQGKRVLLANKESLVMAGSLFMGAVEQYGAELLPVDSEHNAIFQCLPQPFQNLSAAGVEKIILTGSGGPFLNTALDQLHSVTVEQACAHPNWNMGQKISVDSATMMNKGLELIEACWLFRAQPADIEIVLHPQSIIHSMVRYRDGSVIAQLGQPDMRTPIAYCLGWPERLENGVPPLDFYSLANLTFARPCYERYPCLALAMEAMRLGGTHPTALNAANEIAVEAFLTKRIGFLEIGQVVEKVMENWSDGEPVDLDGVIAADQLARQMAIQYLTQRIRVEG